MSFAIRDTTQHIRKIKIKHSHRDKRMKENDKPYVVIIRKKCTYLDNVLQIFLQIHPPQISLWFCKKNTIPESFFFGALFPLEMFYT